MNEKMYEALEVCLSALETGVDIETVLKLYPHLADELRPVLETAVEAQSLAIPAVPEAAMKRGRARVLQHAAGMRETAPKPRRRWSMFAFPRLATSLTIALLFLLSGTGLVSASSGTIPGDSLYPVKRSWEDLRLFFMFSPEGREGLESAFEQERLDEISELLTEGRNETIAFAGLVTAQSNESWKVSGITVMITASSHLPADSVSVGAPVMVIGHTNAQGFVEVDTLDVLGPGASLPPFEPSEGGEPQEHGNAPDVNGDQQPEKLGELTHEFQGVVEAINGNIWTINGQRVNVEFAENRSSVSIGVIAEFEGYYSMDNQFIVTKIEVKSGGL
ncbi:MAG: DUF5667 domain-containing protein, partial [Anaerolineales bacterium]